MVSLGANIADQIVTRVQLRRDDLGQEMVVRLDPPELGGVRIQFRSEQGEITGVIRADNPQTLAELQREAPSLLQRLNEAGVPIRTLNLHLGDLAQQQSRGESHAFAQAQNAYSLFQQNGGDGGGYGDGYRPNDGNDLFAGDPDAWTEDAGQYVSDSALNVMI